MLTSAKPCVRGDRRTQHRKHNDAGDGLFSGKPVFHFWTPLMTSPDSSSGSGSMPTKPRLQKAPSGPEGFWDMSNQYRDLKHMRIRGFE
jgi:hypothetical protein